MFAARVRTGIAFTPCVSRSVAAVLENVGTVAGAGGILAAIRARGGGGSGVWRVMPGGAGTMPELVIGRIS